MQTVLPRWRGFNLLELFGAKSKGKFSEDDFRWIAGWGFDFVRIPMCYRLWVKQDNPLVVRESVLKKIDRVVETGQRYRLHVSLNFHRAPGYSVNNEIQKLEPYNLWKQQEALDAFCAHWRLFAKRYRGIPSKELSFNLVNEPPIPSETVMTIADHARVIRAAVAAIRAIDPERLIIADGVSGGNIACPELADLGIAQSTRAYQPYGISHYQATWVEWGKSLPLPNWPGYFGNQKMWDRKMLEETYRPWMDLADKGIGIHCGEGGTFNKTPHAVFPGWFRDVLDILTHHGIGYALWNFRGAFGILDSERQDVKYEEWHGHKLDRKLLNILQAF